MHPASSVTRGCSSAHAPRRTVPALGGRTALQVYGDLMASFRSEMGPLLGTTITDVLVGLGPDGDLKYPAHPRDKRWTFPGVGEFQVRVGGSRRAAK